MAYADVQALLDDEVLTGRVQGCVLEQASLKDVETEPLASYALAQPASATTHFMYFHGADQALVNKHATGGQAAITDGDILSKVQYVWDDVEHVLNLAAVTT